MSVKNCNSALPFQQPISVPRLAPVNLRCTLLCSLMGAKCLRRRCNCRSVAGIASRCGNLKRRTYVLPQPVPGQDLLQEESDTLVGRDAVVVRARVLIDFTDGASAISSFHPGGCNRFARRCNSRRETHAYQHCDERDAGENEQRRGRIQL